jgi:predicted DNA binding protein
MIVQIMFELFFRFQPGPGHGDQYNSLTEKFPTARFSLWCNGGTDVLEIEASGFSSYEELQKEITATTRAHLDGKIISKTYMQDKFQLVARTCCCSSDHKGTPISPIINRAGFMRIPPLVLAGGWEYHRLVGYDDNDLKGLLRGLDRIGTAEVLHKKSVSEGMTDDTFLLSLSSLFGQLTEKQMKALLTAVENGYYEIPKRITADDLARKQGQPRSTLEEHIRKAESKIVLAMAPYMMMYARVPENPLMNKTKGAGATVGARMMKQVAMQMAAKSRNA